MQNNWTGGIGSGDWWGFPWTDESSLEQKKEQVLERISYLNERHQDLSDFFIDNVWQIELGTIAQELDLAIKELKGIKASLKVLIKKQL